MPLELTDDEQIVLHVHPHWSTLVKGILLLVLIAVVGGAAIFFMPDWSIQNELRIGVAVVAAILAVVTFAGPFLRWFTTHYVLSSHRLVLRTGVLTRTGRDVPLARVSDMQFTQSLLQRFLGSGTLTVESGGDNGQLVLKNVPDVEGMHREAYELINDARPPQA
jgi:uncharacterized membrane protein YdbT with pleckstrin-like domain